MNGLRWLLLSAMVAMGVSGCVITTEDDCTSADNYCGNVWEINYCDEATGELLYADCYDACTTDERVYGATCGTPAATGECALDLGACACWCEDSFDQCVPGTESIQYTRDGNTYEVDCKTYCNGTCDETISACACP